MTGCPSSVAAQPWSAIGEAPLRRVDGRERAFIRVNPSDPWSSSAFCILHSSFILPARPRWPCAPLPPRQISHSEKFDNSLAQKELTWVSQLTLYNASSRSPTVGARLWAKPQPQPLQYRGLSKDFSLSSRSGRRGTGRG